MLDEVIYQCQFYIGLTETFQMPSTPLIANRIYIYSVNLQDSSFDSGFSDSTTFLGGKFHAIFSQAVSQTIRENTDEFSLHQVSLAEAAASCLTLDMTLLAPLDLSHLPQYFDMLQSK